MILIDNPNITNIKIQKPFDIIGDNYTILFQNTVTKDIHIQYVTDESNNLYFSFEVDLTNLTNGEYYILLLLNNNHNKIEVIDNEIENYIEDRIYLLVTNGLTIANKDVVIVNETDSSKIVSRDILRIGNFKNSGTQYITKQQIIAYNPN